MAQFLGEVVGIALDPIAIVLAVFLAIKGKSWKYFAVCYVIFLAAFIGLKLLSQGEVSNVLPMFIGSAIPLAIGSAIGIWRNGRKEAAKVEGKEQ